MISVLTEPRKWEQGSCPLKGSQHDFRTPIEQGKAFRPSGGNVSERQGVEIAAKHIAATMCHEIGFQKAWLIIVPLRKGADGDLMLEQGSGFVVENP